MPIPSILLDSAAPPPKGTAINGTRSAGSSGVLTVQDVTGIDSIEWRLAKPPGSATTINAAGASRTNNFAATIGAFDVVGTYIVTAIANASSSQSSRAAIAVLSPNRSLRVPAFGETYEWDAVHGVEPDYRALVAAVDDGSSSTGVVDVGTLWEGDFALSAEQAAARVIEVRGLFDGSGNAVVFPTGFSLPDGTLQVVRDRTVFSAFAFNTGISTIRIGATDCEVAQIASDIWLQWNGGVFTVTNIVPYAPTFSTVNILDAPYTAYPYEWASQTIRITGALSADRKLTMPLAVARTWTIVNDTTGGHSVIVGGATGTTASVAAGARTVFSDGANFFA